MTSAPLSMTNPASDARHDAPASPVTTTVTVTLRYFAWVREKIGRAEETVAVPAGVTTVAELVAWLAGQGDEYAAAFANPTVVRTAIDQSHVSADAAIAGAREIAFFPPVTGG